MGSHNNLGWYTTIEDYVFLGGHVTGANDKRIAWCRKIDDNDFRGYTIKRAARIGLGVIFMPGVVVGEEALVGTASLVTRNVKPMEIVYGVPAKHQGWVERGEKLRTSV
jgi:UDP-2-acetamido-3-amino-2,3-dideoxy-glucuronate N-acetyltransferase